MKTVVILKLIVKICYLGPIRKFHKIICNCIRPDAIGVILIC